MSKSTTNLGSAEIKQSLERILDLALEEPQTNHTRRGIAVISAATLYDMEHTDNDEQGNQASAGRVGEMQGYHTF